MMKGKLPFLFLVPVLFLAVYIAGQPQVYKQEAVSAAPTFTSIGDCKANENCPTSEPNGEFEPTLPTQIEHKTEEKKVQIIKADEPKNSTPNTIEGLIRRIIELLLQLLNGGGNCPDHNNNQIRTNNVDDINAYHKSKEKKQGLLKRIKCKQGGKPSDGTGGQPGGGNPQPTAAPQPTNRPQLTAAPQPTNRPQPTAAPQPTNRPQPTAAPQPTNRPQPTAAPQPTVAPTRAVSPTTASAGGLGACTGGPQATEPAHNYTRTTYGGRTVNIRTREMLMIAAGFFGSPFTLTQGSYNTGVAASAGTHDGGGVVDISVNGMSATQRISAARALRMAGFTAWIRTPAQGFAYHIHANAIGDREMASGARNQVTSFFNGRNGLAGNGPDTEAETAGRPLPSWAAMYGTCR